MGADTADDLLRSGREALASGDWGRARSCFEKAAELGETAEILDSLSQAVHFQGDHARAIELKERAFAAYRRRGKRVEAAELARWLAFLHGSVHGNMAAANGWMARAESLLEEVEPCAAHGWLTLDRAPFSPDSTERERLAVEALTIARRFSDRDLEFSAMALLGEAYVASGRVAEGMTLLDETMAAVSGGEVAGIGYIGEIYCRLLSACEHAADVRRAEQWMAAASRSVAWTDFAPPTCRYHYGGILIAIGRWAEAEEQLLAAIRAFDSGYHAERVFPLVRLADLRARQGRFEEAERLLEGGEWHRTARQVLATIALGRGDLALAEDRVRLCLEAEDRSDPACAPLLALLVTSRSHAAGTVPPSGRSTDSTSSPASPVTTAHGPAPSWRPGGFARRKTTRGPPPTCRRPSKGSRPSICRSRPDGRSSSSRERLARGLPKPPSQRPAWRSRPSNAWARSATPTRRATCSGGWEPAGEPGQGGKES
jgi:tetratricopeptide (TPR) repeat protein